MIVFGTRGSDLARTQTGVVAEFVKANTGEDYRIEVLTTRGDREVDRPLPEIGGTGLFTAELEAALRSGAIDVAVHSLKDLPVADPEGLVVAAIPMRAAAHDVLVCRRDAMDPLGGRVPLLPGKQVGSSSPRRLGAMRRLRPDLEFVDVRGNVPTRIEKVRAGVMDAVILAAAGLDRLGIDFADDAKLACVDLPLEDFPPAPGQGALGVQCREDDTRMRKLLESIHDTRAAAAAQTERALLGALGGGCSMPLGAYVCAEEGGDWRLHAGLFPLDARAGGVFFTRTGSDLDALVRAGVEALGPMVGAPLEGRRIVTLRPRGETQLLEDFLTVAGAQVVRIAASEIDRVVPATETLVEYAQERPLLAFTSARAVKYFFELLDDAGVAMWPDYAYAVGSTTGAALRARGVEAREPPDAQGGARLARFIIENDPADGRSVLLPCALDCHPAFQNTLTEAGISVEVLPVYRISPCNLHAHRGQLASADAIVVTSPSAARALATARGDRKLTLAPCVALGESTAAQLADVALHPAALAATPTPPAVLEALLEIL